MGAMGVLKWVWAFGFVSTLAHAGIFLKDVDQTRTELGLNQYPYTTKLESIPIAVIDKGFGAPGDTTDHGMRLALGLHALSGADQKSPISDKILRLKANSLEMLDQKADECIAKGVKIVLYAQNFEFYGNFDGSGPVNKIIKKLIAKGIIVIVAAGNYGGRVYNGFVKAKGAKFKKNEWLMFETKDGLRDHLRVKNTTSNFKSIITLAYKGQGNNFDDGIDKDLDLYVWDENDNEVASETDTQVLKKEKREKNETYVPGQRVTPELQVNEKKNGYYKIKVKAKTDNFTSDDWLRITVMDGETASLDESNKYEELQFVDATEGGEIMTPADDIDVITVGSTSARSSRGPTKDGRMKPDVIMTKFDATFSDKGGGRAGDTIASMYFAAQVRQMMAYNENLRSLRDLKTIIDSMPDATSELGNRADIKRFVSGSSEETRALNLYSHALEEMRKRVGDWPAVVGQYRSNYVYAVGMRVHPTMMGDLFPKLPEGMNPALYEYYLVARDNGEGKEPWVQGLIRSKSVNSEGKQEAYPWEKENISSRYFLEVRQVRYSEDIKRMEKRIGKVFNPPTRARLNELLGE